MAGQLFEAKDQQIKFAWWALYCLATSLQFLCKQGLAICSHINGESNLRQLLALRSSASECLSNWLKRDTYIWTSHDCENKIIEIMALTVVQQKMHCANYFAILINEATNVSVNELVSI